MNWLLVFGLGSAWLGWQIVWAAPLPRQLRRGDVPRGEPGSAKAFQLFWLDQYGWLGMTLLLGGVLLALAGLVS